VNEVRPISDEVWSFDKTNAAEFHIKARSFDSEFRCQGLHYFPAVEPDIMASAFAEID
jgi:hypothetical protein